MESFVEKQVRLVLEAQCREMARDIKARCPAGVGFVLLMADLGAGNLAYMSSIERRSAIKVVEEWLATVKETS